jgi:thiosulfate/3-mercaptopyruvate sulfurtransferase
MHRTLPALLLAGAIICHSTPAAAQDAATPRAAGGTFVNSAWLASHQSDPNLVLLYVGTDSVYQLSHIPGSRLADRRMFAAPFDTAAMAMMHDPARRTQPHALTLELPAAARLDSALAQAGITSRSTVVLTYEDWFTPAARILLTLEYAGLKGHAFLLDRSVSLWKAEGHPVTAAIPAAPRPGDYHPVPNAGALVVDAAFVAAHLKSPKVRIIDARDPEFYNGTQQSEMNPRGGHIPGAHSIPYVTLSDSAGHMLPDAELRRIFTAAGVSPGDTVVSYCHIGQQGSLVWAVARELGLTARLYDGSFEDWSTRSDLPVEGGK